MKPVKPGRNSIMAGALWVSLVLAMFASMHHVADQFGSLERPGNEALGWAAAIAIDAGILALAYGLRTRRKANRSRGASARLWFGVLFLTGISITANFLAAQSVRPDAIFQSVAFSATLPIIVILLADVVSSDDEKAAKRADTADANAAKVSELTRQLADTARQLAEANDNVAKLTDRLARVTDNDSQAVITDRTKAGFLSFMQTGNGNRPANQNDIMALYGVSERTAYRWWQEWQEMAPELDGEKRN